MPLGNQTIFLCNRDFKPSGAPVGIEQAGAGERGHMSSSAPSRRRRRDQLSEGGDKKENYTKSGQSVRRLHQKCDCGEYTGTEVET